MAGRKTRPSGESVEAFLAGIPDEGRRRDCVALTRIMKKVTRSAPEMWGPSIVGFGSYHYRYESGREGDCFLVGFAPRKRDLSLYIMAGVEPYADRLAQLGKHRTGKACLYVKSLADVDLTVLEKILRASVAQLRKSRSSPRPLEKRSGDMPSTPTRLHTAPRGTRAYRPGPAPAPFGRWAPRGRGGPAGFPAVILAVLLVSGCGSERTADRAPGTADRSGSHAGIGAGAAGHAYSLAYRLVPAAAPPSAKHLRWVDSLVRNLGHRGTVHLFLKANAAPAGPDGAAAGAVYVHLRDASLLLVRQENGYTVLLDTARREIGTQGVDGVSLHPHPDGNLIVCLEPTPGTGILGVLLSDPSKSGATRPVFADGVAAWSWGPAIARDVLPDEAP